MDKSIIKKRKNLIRNFLKTFPNAFQDETYDAWERDYKWQAHLRWKKSLNKNEFQELLRDKKFDEICKRAINIESRTNLLFSFEKMALRDALKEKHSAEEFASGLYELVYGSNSKYDRFEDFIAVIAALPHKKSRVLTWPIASIFGFIGNPKQFIYVKPTVTKLAAKAYGYPLDYKSRPNKMTYKHIMQFADLIKKDLKTLKPVDYIDLQSFIWTLGSDEYS